MHRILSIVVPILACAVGFSCGNDVHSAPPPPTTRPRATSSEWTGVHNAARVSANLYRGGQPTQAGFATLKSMGIKTIVDLRGKSHLDKADGLGLSLVHIPANIERPNVEQIIAFLHLMRSPASTPVFIHDDLGADRVGLFVAAYRMVEEDWSADDALAELPQFRFDVYWISVPKFIRHLDVKAIREKLDAMPTTRPATKPAPTVSG